MAKDNFPEPLDFEAAYEQVTNNQAEVGHEVSAAMFYCEMYLLTRMPPEEVVHALVGRGLYVPQVLAETNDTTWVTVPDREPESKDKPIHREIGRAVVHEPITQSGKQHLRYTASCTARLIKLAGLDVNVRFDLHVTLNQNDQPVTVWNLSARGRDYKDAHAAMLETYKLSGLTGHRLELRTAAISAIGTCAADVENRVLTTAELAEGSSISLNVGTYRGLLEAAQYVADTTGGRDVSDRERADAITAAAAALADIEGGD